MGKIIQSKINWSEEAEEKMRDAPAFIRPMIIKKVEKIAAEKGVEIITDDFLKSVREKHQHHNKKTEKSISDFYAKTDDKPIYSGFFSKANVHAGMSGKPVGLDNLSDIWKEVALQKDNSERRAIYIHVPFCLSRCKFCHFYQSRTKNEELDIYSKYLLKELENVSKSNFAKSKPINAIYFGGGTPTDLSPNSLKNLLSHLNNNWNISNDCEITIEGRIFGFDDDKILTCLDNGVNRFSFGVQSFDTKIRRQMGRIESRENIISKINNIAKLNQANISIDLIYGLPDQTDEIWLNDLETAANTKSIDSCSVYNLKLMPGTPILKESEAGKYSAPADTKRQADMFLKMNDYYKNRNIKRLGLRHWAFSNRERSIYNFIIKYEQTCLPIGNGAGGRIGNYRIFQSGENKDYYKKIEAGEKPIAMALQLPENNKINGRLIGSLEENLCIDFASIEKEFNLPNLTKKFVPLLNQWQEAGMIFFDDKIMKLTEAGEFWNVNIAQNLIDYLKL